MNDAVLGSLAAALVLSSVHLFSWLLRLLREIPRSRLLSLAGGMSVAYVVLRLLPSIQESQRAIIRTEEVASIPFLRNHAYVVVLISIVVFYGLERVVRQSRKEQRERAGTDCTSQGVFWLSISTFALVNLLIGYVLMFRLQQGAQALFLFVSAMLLKFIVSDHGLTVDHKEAFQRIGRWILIGAVLAGWALSVWMPLPTLVPAVLQAFIAGAVILNVLKEELPEARESRYWAFAAGALIYGTLLLTV